MESVSHYEVLQLPIVSLETAEVVGTVDGLVLDVVQSRVVAFVTRMGFYEASVLLMEDAHAVGRDAVMIPDEAVLRRISEDVRLEALIDADLSLSGATVLTTAGRAVGVVGAYYLDRKTGRLTGVQLVPPIEIDTVPEGLLPFTAVRRIGDSLFLVDDAYQAMLVQDEDGLAAAVDVAPAVLSAGVGEVPEAPEDGAPPAAVPAATRSAMLAAEKATTVESDRPKERRPRRSRSRRQTEPPPDAAAANQGEAVAEPGPADEAQPAGQPEAADEAEAAGQTEAADEAQPPGEADTPDASVTEASWLGSPRHDAPPAPVETPSTPEGPASEAAGSAGAAERHFLVGRRALRRIEASDGTLIAEEGDTVTPEMVGLARAKDQLLILGLNAE